MRRGPGGPVRCLLGPVLWRHLRRRGTPEKQSPVDAVVEEGVPLHGSSAEPSRRFLGAVDLVGIDRQLLLGSTVGSCWD
jgi:hypothetical protein